MTTALLAAPLSFDAAAVETRAKRLCEMIAEGMASRDEAVYDDDRVEPIESEARDGFSPWTSGGYMVTLAASLAFHARSDNAPAPVQSLIDTGNEMLAEEWARRYPDRPPFNDALRGEHTGWQADAEQWEAEWWQTDTDVYFWKARVMFLAPGDPSFRFEEVGAEEPYVYVDAYLNTDLNYGRDHIGWLSAFGGSPNQTVGDLKRVIPLRVFATMTDQQLQEVADAAVEALP